MRWVREPLVHFLVLGLLLFGGYALLHRNAVPGPDSNRIVLTAGDLHQLQIAFAAQWQRMPTSEEMVGLAESRVHEEVLYREALRLGLDKDDTIVRRRMAQKMEFLIEDKSVADEPSSAQLQAWFKDHAKEFALPPRVSFREVYFSPDRRGTRAQADAAEAQGLLAGKPVNAPAAAQEGDPFVFQTSFTSRTPEQVAKDFGPDFAKALFTLSPGSWQGPIQSGYGWHVVFVTDSIPGRIPAFEEVEPKVVDAWKDERRSVALRKEYADLRAQYEVVLEVPDGAATQTAEAAQAIAPTTGAAATAQGTASPGHATAGVTAARL